MADLDRDSKAAALTVTRAISTGGQANAYLVILFFRLVEKRKAEAVTPNIRSSETDMGQDTPRTQQDLV